MAAPTTKRSQCGRREREAPGSARHRPVRSANGSAPRTLRTRILPRQGRLEWYA